MTSNMTRVNKAMKRAVKDKEAVSNPLTPFIKTPTVLQPFLEALTPEEVYLVHIDTHRSAFKRQLFVLPALLNVAIVLLVAYRAYKGLYFYPGILATLVGLSTSMSIDTSALSWKELVGHILRRAVIFAIDYFLLTLFLPWPIRFIKGPVKWRRAIGFREREVVVRRSRKTWSQKLVRNRWIYDDAETVRGRVVPAVGPIRIQKSGFLLVDADWDLDYDAMVLAHQLVDLTRKGQGVQLDEFRTAVLVRTDEDGWLIWRVADEGKEQVAQRDKIVAMKDKLTAIGKEDLFFQWVELIQFESTRPGGFTPERQRIAMSEVQQMFANEGVDFSSLWQEVGGIERDLPEPN